jgi:hypothetical protein
MGMGSVDTIDLGSMWGSRIRRVEEFAGDVSLVSSMELDDIKRLRLR